MPIYSIGEHIPQLHQSVYLAPGACVIGKVTIGAGSSVWFNCVVRGDEGTITIGEDSNIQDLSVCHVDPGYPLILGDRVTVGHQCVLHGCVIEDDCLIGMGGVVLTGAKIGRGSIVGAGAVVLENTEIPPFSLVVGAPAKVRKTYDESILKTIKHGATAYVENAQRYAVTLQERPGSGGGDFQGTQATCGVGS